MRFEFSGEVIEWRGPPPYLFLPLADELSEEIRECGKSASYLWGMIPVYAHIGGSRFRTAMFPKGTGYWLPIKVAVQKAESISASNVVAGWLEIDFG